MPQTAIGYGAMIILLAASTIGASISAWKIKRLRLQVCLLSGVAYYAALLCITALFFGGQYQGMGVTALVVLAGTGVAILLSTREKKTRKYRKGRRGS